MRHGIVKSVRPIWRIVLEDRHRRIVREVVLVQHLELFIATDLKEGCSHASNVFELHSSVQMEDFTLTRNLLEPLLLGEFLAETMPVGVSNNRVI